MVAAGPVPARTRGLANSGYFSWGTRASGHLGRLRELAHVDPAHQLLDLPRVDEPGAEARGRLRTARDAEAQALAGRAPLVAGGDVAGQERVAGADRRHGLAGLDHHAEQRRDALDEHAGDAAVGDGHDRLAR